jgi:8-oxo-dGTP diphosphatase
MRAQVVLIRDGKVLLARHECSDRTYWVLPGGSVEAGESPEEAAVREVREETGLKVHLRRLLFVDEPREDEAVTIKSPRYTYLGEVIGGSLRGEGDPGRGHAEKGRLAGAEWLPLDHEGFDAGTRDTLRRVEQALNESASGGSQAGQ